MWKKFKNSTTSKQLTWVFTFFYMIQNLLVGFVKTKWDVDLYILLNYTTPIMGSVFFFYFGKSGMENYQKIKKSPDEFNNENEIIQ